ncbi:hypothetical protein ITJ38_17770 [Agreia pratensis]|uniref:hypothetical protein n=1 Tax=Agreia pratensis TaxID=150121 RepID=UPI00188DB748|nr:hypothetical protein [Agreia pratensis]MBF4636263.1 hypothetical protein [Agreia pratensis]
MGIDFIERFFKLTLDNMYRFTCSLLFIISLVAHGREMSPVEQVVGVLDWLAIPSSWLIPVGEWVNLRQDVIAGVAFITLIVAIAFAAANDWHNRSGSTALLSIVILIQVDQEALVINSALVLVAILTLASGLTAVLCRRVGWGPPAWIESAWRKVAHIFMTLVLAALYLFSPFGWMVSQEPYNTRGSRRNPLFIEQAKA